MKTVHTDFIIDLYVWLDDSLEKQATTGRPPALPVSEMLAILIQSALTENHQCLQDIYDWVKRTYKNFVLTAHRALPTMTGLLNSLLASGSPLRLADSTMVPVCKPYRAQSHRVAKGVAKWGRNGQGWHFGFKLHLAINHLNQVTSLVFTPANQHDNQVMDQLVNCHTRILVGDRHYGGSVQRRRLWRLFGTLVVAPAQYKQNKRLLTDWYLQLLHKRPKIEAVFGLLKEKFRLVSSYPRSVAGYFVHYLRILLGYQVGLVS